MRYGSDAGVAVSALGRDGFQRVRALLLRQRSYGFRHIGADIAGRQIPTAVAALLELVQVKRLVCAVERPQPQMEHDQGSYFCGHGEGVQLNRSAAASQRTALGIKKMGGIKLQVDTDALAAVQATTCALA